MKTFDQFIESVNELSVGDGAIPLGPDSLVRRRKKKKKCDEAQDYDSDEVGEVPRDRDLSIDIDKANKGRLVRNKDIKKINLLGDNKKVNNG